MEKSTAHMDDRTYLDFHRIKCGMQPAQPMDKYLARAYGEFSYERLSNPPWVKPFIEHMINRLIIGALRYGVIEGRSETYDYVKAMQRRLDRYQVDYNQDMLFDVANFAALEFAFPPADRPVHFTPTDDSEHEIPV